MKNYDLEQKQKTALTKQGTGAQNDSNCSGYNMAYLCPHCRSDCWTIRTKWPTELVYEQTFICRNPDCACSFITDQQVKKQLSPSGNPNPNINLPTRTKPK